MVMQITFVALDRKKWELALHDIYQVGDSDNVDTFKEYVRNRRTHANDIIEEVNQAYLVCYAAFISGFVTPRSLPICSFWSQFQVGIRCIPYVQWIGGKYLRTTELLFWMRTYRPNPCE